MFLPYFVALHSTRSMDNTKEIKSKEVEPKKKQTKPYDINTEPCNKCNCRGWINSKTGLPIENGLNPELENMLEDEPLYIHCPNCHGMRYLKINKFKTCNNCKSRGWINSKTGLPIENGLNAELENMVEDEPQYIMCPNCLGTGHTIL